MGITSRSGLAFPPEKASLEREAALPVSFESTPPSVRVSNIGGFSWVIDELVRDILGRAVFVTENDVFLGDMGVHSRGGGCGGRTSHVAVEEMVSCRDGRFAADSRRATVNGAHGTESIGRIICLLRSDWCLRWLDVCVCTDASGKGHRVCGP